MARLTIVLSGMVGGNPGQGGAAWAVLQYALGLKRLGHNVCLVEPIRQADLKPAAAALDRSENAAYFLEVTSAFGLASTSAMLLVGTRDTVGLGYGSLRATARRADLLINISGLLTDESLLEGIPRRVYVDLDPAFTQLWQVNGIDMAFQAHTHFVTVGQAIGRPDCSVPLCGHTWITSWQPVVLTRWPLGDCIEYDGFTTIANWRGYGSIEHGGVFYGQKAHSLRSFMGLPTRTRSKLLLALAIHPGESEDLAALTANGWHLLDPAHVAGTPSAYQRFVQRSRAEFGIAKSGYVVSRCGWFSDRSACYLASGRPVLAQETGFSGFIPTGRGLLAFETEEQILAGVDTLLAEYDKHRRAARDIAEQYFDSDRVLARLLDQVSTPA